MREEEKKEEEEDGKKEEKMEATPKILKTNLNISTLC